MTKAATKPAPKAAAGAAEKVVTPPGLPAGMKAFTETIPGTTVAFDMIALPGGSFKMSDGKQVEVKPFWIEKMEVRWEEYDQYYLPPTKPTEKTEADAVTKPSRTYIPPDWGFGHNGFPALSIHPNGAEHYVQWLSLKTGHKYRLPTEAEWEWACRAGGAGTYKDPAQMAAHAWVKENSNRQAHPAGKKLPNAWGLYDILGNASELCKAADGTYIVKGGSWRQAAKDVNCAWRDEQNPAWQSDDPQIPKSKWWLANGDFIGFRVVREAD